MEMDFFFFFQNRLKNERKKTLYLDLIFFIYQLICKGFLIKKDMKRVKPNRYLFLKK